MFTALPMNSKRISSKIIVLASSILLLSQALPALADDGASLDSMWIDQEAPTIDKDAEQDNAGKGAGSASQSSAATVASVGGVPSTVAPMCSFDEFRASSFVSKGSWPGIGPFKASANDISEMSDEKQNRLKVSVKNEQVTSAKLELGKLGSGNVRDFLDIEMSSDFLLESLGAKPRKIAEFNKALEKNKQALKPGAKSLSLTAGRYQVLIDRSKNAQPYSCLIAVNSLDASKKVLAEHSSSTGEEEETPKVETPKVQHPILEAIKKPSTIIKPKTPASIAPTVDPRREEFVATIKAWQQIKKAALKKRDPSHLPEILSGAALAKQSTAVKWLQTHGNYYDMEPRGCVVDKYTDLGGGKKYSVVAQVREFSKYIRESDNSVLKEVDDKYTVNYTIEKVNDKWLINDSSVLSQPAASSGQTNKTPGKR
ncbi:MAG: ARC6/PARC6 family protein [Candidatus Obscuribacterales bacterium]|nr:ARC6/PARC6 family protein [Candidatus Obscuribacterales bacterium]